MRCCAIRPWPKRTWAAREIPPRRDLVLASFLALGSAALYGAADFLGGLAARRACTVRVVLVSQVSGIEALAIILPWLPSASPLVARFASASLFAVAALVGRPPLRMARPVAAITIACGVIDMLANALYLLATHHGPLTVGGDAGVALPGEHRRARAGGAR